MEKRNKTIITVSAVFLAIITVAIIGTIVIQATPANRLKRQLRLAQKYLNELNYEQAVLAYQEAISIDPKCEQAYFAIADIYIKTNEEERAVEILEQAQANIQTDALSARLDEIRKQAATAEREKETKPVRQPTVAASSSTAAAKAPMPKSFTVMVDNSIVTETNGAKEFYEYLKTLLGDGTIDITWIRPEHARYYEVVSNAFNSANEKPDVVFLSSEYYALYAASGMLWDMTDAWNNSATKNSGRLVATADNIYNALKVPGPDGKERMYGFSPYRGNGCCTYVKKTWLEAAGMQVSDVEGKTLTFDQYYDMLKKMQESKNSTVIASPGYIGLEPPYTNYLPEFYQKAQYTFYKGADGKYVDGFQEQAMQDALTRIRTAVQDGVIDSRSAREYSTSNCRDKFYADETGVFTYWAGTWANVLKVNLEAKGLDGTLIALNPIKELKKGMTEELEMIDKLFKDGSGYSSDAYIKLAQEIADRKGINEKLKTRAESKATYLDELKKAYIEVKDDDFPDAPPLSIDKSEWSDPVSGSGLYNSLRDSFDEGDDSTAKQKKKEAEKKKKEAEEALKKDEETTARDIPSEFNLGTDSSSQKFALGTMIKNAASYFKHDSLAEAGNEALLKFYVTEYDFGMFSSRVTNVKSEKTGASAGTEGAAGGAGTSSTEDAGGSGASGSSSGTSKEVKKSLTGYTMGRDINYLYKAELEYLFGGHNKSKDNLNEARNKILAFRAVVNYSATYTIKEVNDTIKTISKAAAGVNPLLGIAVSAALRLAVAGIETSADWTEMMNGNSVNLLKTELKHLTLGPTVAELVGCSEPASGDSDSDKTLKLSYEQYLMVMLLFMTTSEELISRTGDLIALNVSAVRKGVGENGELTELLFKTDKAVTAVNATCSVHLGFVVMPQGFAKQTLSSDTYAEVEEFQKNSYKFTVTRGY